MSGRFDVAVVGGGLVGLATARALAIERGRSVVVLEAEAAIATHQSGHNSGVVHSGLYYRPGSEKAKLCAEGREALFRYAAERGIPHERCGKVVVALSPRELPRLDELERRGRANGLDGIVRLDAAGIREREPHAAGIAGLFVPETGIIDFSAVARALAGEIEARGGEIRTRSRVERIRENGAALRLDCGGAEIEARVAVNCAGLESDRVARAAGVALDLRIVPFRGDYYELAPERRSLVRHLLYPVPDPDLPFLGVHFTRMISGRVEAGPNAVLAWSRKGYSRTSFSPRDAWETIAFGGFWRFSPRHAGAGLAELRRAWSRGAFVTALRRLLPDLREEDVQPAGCGLRAQAMDRKGRLVDDFAIRETARSVHVLNAPSPAATASLAIGIRIAALAAAKL